MNKLPTTLGTRAAFRTALALAASLTGASIAIAQVPSLDEVRFGIMVHSIEPHNAETGADVNFELLFRRFSYTHTEALLDMMLRPRIHLGVSANTAGDTSQIYAGLTWDAKITSKLSLELSFGAAWHNGPTGDDAADSYGCVMNFRESLSLGYALDSRWTLYGTIAHMSNARLCDENTGITSVGIRLGYHLE